MIRELATITGPGHIHTVWTRLEVEELKAEKMPRALTGTLEYAEGSVEELVAHATEPSKRLWFLGNRIGYQFQMDGAGPQFTATREPVPPRESSWGRR